MYLLYQGRLVYSRDFIPSGCYITTIISGKINLVSINDRDYFYSISGFLTPIKYEGEVPGSNDSPGIVHLCNLLDKKYERAMDRKYVYENHEQTCDIGNHEVYHISADNRMVFGSLAINIADSHFSDEKSKKKDYAESILTSFAKAMNEPLITTKSARNMAC